LKEKNCKKDLNGNKNKKLD